MTEPTVITGNSEAEIGQQIAAYFGKEGSAFQHALSIQHGGQTVLLEIDIDPGGGFESGYATTRFSAPVEPAAGFAFTIYPEGFLADVGKLFGLQDEIIGYPEFDKKLIIKTDDKEKVHALFNNETTRQALTALQSFNLQLQRGDEENSTGALILEIEEGMTEGAGLVKLYLVFNQVLTAINKIV